MHSFFHGQRRRSWLAAIGLGLSCQILVSCDSADTSRSEELHLGTASLGGAFYPVGQSASNLVSKYADNLSMLPVVSAGAIQNPRLVHAGEIDVGITNAYMAWLGANGEPPYSEKLNLRALGTIHASILHMVTLKGSEITRFDQLRGKRVAVGPAGGGTYGFLERLLDIHGMSIEDITPSYLSYTDGFTQLGDGNVDAAFALAGYPTSAVMQALATHDLAFIELSDDILQQVKLRFPYYTQNQLPKDVYRLDNDVSVIGVHNMLVVRADMDGEKVFQIASAIYGHMQEFARSNAIAKQIDPLQSLQLAIPLHRGAQRYFDALTQPLPEDRDPGAQMVDELPQT